MLSYLFFFLASVANSFLDTFVFRADRSVFKNVQDKVNPFLTNATAPKFLGTSIDPYHIVKLAMIGFLSLSVYFGGNNLGFWDLLIYPICWSFGFELFWGYILYRPKNVL